MHPNGTACIFSLYHQTACKRGCTYPNACGLSAEEFHPAQDQLWGAGDHRELAAGGAHRGGRHLGRLHPRSLRGGRPGPGASQCIALVLIILPCSSPLSAFVISPVPGSVASVSLGANHAITNLEYAGTL